MENRITLNRTLCAFCGQIGKGIAIAVDTVGHAMGMEPERITQLRTLGAQTGAFAAAALGMPEAALAIASTTSAMPYNPMDMNQIIDRVRQQPAKTANAEQPNETAAG